MYSSEVDKGPADAKERKAALKKQTKKRALVRDWPILSTHTSHWPKQPEDRDGRGLDDRENGRREGLGGIPVVAVTDEPHRRSEERSAVVSRSVRIRSEYCIVAK